MLTLPAEAFEKADPAPDGDFYASPRFVTHIDDRAIAAVTELYREEIPEGGAVLDLMSSWISHLPPEARYARVTGQGMNAAELARNPRLNDRFVQNLNEGPGLPLESDGFDAVLCCASVQYLQRPVEVWREALRVTKPGGKALVTFSNRCFPTKAVRIWTGLSDADHVRLVGAYLHEAGWTDVRGEDRSPALGRPALGRPALGRSDPLYAVIGTKPLS